METLYSLSRKYFKSYESGTATDIFYHVDTVPVVGEVIKGVGVVVKVGKVQLWHNYLNRLDAYQALTESGVVKFYTIDKEFTR